MAGQKLGVHYLKGLLAFATLGLIAAVPLGFIGYLAQIEHDRRVTVMRTGLSASAIVTESFKGTSRVCAFSYHFSLNGNQYDGGQGGCPLVAKHPVGSRLSVRYDPQDPENSVAIGADVWPGWAIVPVLIGLSLIPLAGIFIYALVTNAPRSRRCKKAVR